SRPRTLNQTVRLEDIAIRRTGRFPVLDEAECLSELMEARVAPECGELRQPQRWQIEGGQTSGALKPRHHPARDGMRVVHGAEQREPLERQDGHRPALRSLRIQLVVEVAQ